MEHETEPPKQYYIMEGTVEEGGVPLDEGPFESTEAAGARCRSLLAERKARGSRSKFTVFSTAIVYFKDPQEVCLARSCAPSQRQFSLGDDGGPWAK